MESMHRIGSEMSTPEMQPSPHHGHGSATDFEAAVFEEAAPIDAAAQNEMTAENIVRMFSISSLYREAFSNQEWGK